MFFIQILFQSFPRLLNYMNYLECFRSTSKVCLVKLVFSISGVLNPWSAAQCQSAVPQPPGCAGMTPDRRQGALAALRRELPSRCPVLGCTCAVCLVSEASSQSWPSHADGHTQSQIELHIHIPPKPWEIFSQGPGPWSLHCSRQLLYFPFILNMGTYANKQ